MKTAILISGQLRTFAQCYASQRWHVYRHFPDVHFFITVQGDSSTTPAEIAQLRKDYGEERVHYDPRTDPHVLPKAAAGPVLGGEYILLTSEMQAAFHQAPYANAAPAAQLLMQHWYQQKCWEHFCGSEHRVASSELPKFETILRVRGDMFFHSFDSPISPIRPIGPMECFTPWFGRFGGVNDRVSVIGRDAARAYFTIYEQIPALLAKGCPFHPESLVKAALLENGCTLHETLKTEFTTWRADGNHRAPEIMSCDLAHAALRAA